MKIVFPNHSDREKIVCELGRNFPVWSVVQRFVYEGKVIEELLFA